MDKIQQALLLILSVSIISIILIEKNKVKKHSQQVFVFLIVFLVHLLGYFLWKKMYCDKEENKKQLEKDGLDKERLDKERLEKERLERAIATKKMEFTSDAIIPIKSYNPRDCTNDGSCIVPADKANLHGFYEKKGQNPFVEFDSKESSELKPCIRCNRPLTLYNNPPTEQFLPTCSCNFCTREIKDLDLNNKMCVYCKTGYLKNNQCFNPSKIPNALFIEKK